MHYILSLSRMHLGGQRGIQDPKKQYNEHGPQGRGPWFMVHGSTDFCRKDFLHHRQLGPWRGAFQIVQAC